MAQCIAQLPTNEAERLAELHDYRILDTPSEDAFDYLAKLAAQTCGTPIGIVAFVDAERVWAKAQVGLEAQELPRSCSLCARAILEPEVFVVEDVAATPEFASYPLAAAEVGVRFFAGAPLINQKGYALGGLCVLDRVPRGLTPQQKEALQILGRQVVMHLELRRNLRRLEQTIADHEQAEAALRDSELLYHSLVECLPQNIFRKDTRGVFTFVNKLFCQTVGRPAKEIIGKTDFDFFPADLAAKYQADDRNVMSTGTPFETVEEHVRPDGARLYVHVLKTPLYDGTGKVIGVQGIFWDVTEQRRTEAELAHERDLLRALLDNVPDAVYFKDLYSRFVRCSRALAAKFGLSDPAELVGKTDFDFFTEEHARPAFEDEQRIIRTGEPVIGLTEKETLPDGRVTWALTSKLPLRNKDGEIVGTFGISKDITQLKQAEQELAKARDLALESTRLKSEFLANMSHELRTPMNAVIGMTDLLLGTQLTPEQRDYAETIHSSADALLGIINDILDFSKIEARRMRLESVDFDLREAVEGTAELLAESAHRKGLELVCWVDERLPARLRGDPGRLRQLLTNLLGNAVKFTARGEVVLQLTLAAESQGSVRVRGEVRDTGIGISKDAQARIFEAFSQADGSTTRNYGGTGLGLAISKQLVELMGGRIGVESELGAGSTFWFEVELAYATTAAEPQPPALWKSLAGRRVLVVDDNATARQILARQLAGQSMQPAEAPSGPAALELLRAAAQAGAPYDLVILDAQMPEMDGLALAQAIRADPCVAYTPLIMLTSLGCRREPDQLRAAGVAACLPKPVRHGRLYDTVAKVLNGETPAAPGTLSLGPAAPAGICYPQSPRRAQRVLVAEDNSVNQKLILLQLRKLGYCAEAVANGLQVLAALDRAPYDVLLLDCQMPELDGYETARRIRLREAQATGSPDARPRLRIIALTAHALAGERERCLEAGMDDYLSKPVRLRELAAALQLSAPPTPPRPDDSPEPGLGADEAPVNLDFLRALGASGAPGQPDPVGELAKLFVASAEPLIAQMKAAAELNQAPELKAAAHTLKGSAKNLGASRLAALCAQVERCAAAGCLTDTRLLLEQLGCEFARVREALAAHTERTP